MTTITTNSVDRFWLKQSLVRGEALRLIAYDDKTGRPLKTGDVLQGKLTIGVGRNLTDVGITEAEAMWMLDDDMERSISEAEALPECRGLDRVRRTVLVEMIFNLGLPRLLKFKRMLAALATHNFGAAADEMLDSKWARQVGQRADRLARIMRSGRFED